jgi:hypothetical protein
VKSIPGVLQKGRGKMGTGKLYLGDEKFVVDVDYEFRDTSGTKWWGEFIPTEYTRLSDGNGYVIAFEDDLKGRCSIHKRVNGATVGVPPRYRYYFKAAGPLEEALIR